SGRRPEEEPDRAVSDARGRHGVARGSDRPPDRTDQRPHGALQDPREGPSLPPRPSHADREAPRVDRIPAHEGPRAVPRRHRKTRYPSVTAAAGRIPGGYFKREGRPVEKEVLTSRLIHRPIRPLFPKGFANEVQVICLAISADRDNDPDVLALNGASAALCLSGIPFQGPVGAVRVGRVDGRLIVNPTTSEQSLSSLDLVIAATEEAVLMVESGASEVGEETMLEAIAFGHEHCRRLVRL